MDMKIPRKHIYSWLAAISSGFIAAIAISQSLKCYKTVLVPSNCYVTSVLVIVLVIFVNFFIQSSIRKIKDKIINFNITVPLVSLALFSLLSAVWQKDTCTVIYHPDTREDIQQEDSYYIWQLGYWTVLDNCPDEEEK